MITNNEILEAFKTLNTNVDLKIIYVKDLVDGYFNGLYKDSYRNEEYANLKQYYNEEILNSDGAYALKGELNIRPVYQRDFVYKKPEQIKVIETILAKKPLNNIYFSAKTDTNPFYEVVDGQQRLLSICEFVKGEQYPLNNHKTFLALTKTEQETILNYPIFVYVIHGSDEEKLKWFETINIANNPLTKQELRNAIYHSSWLDKMKAYFAKSNGIGVLKAKHLVSTKNFNRQLLLEKALNWIVHYIKANSTTLHYKIANLTSIESYMAYMKNHPNETSIDLIKHYEAVLKWVDDTFYFSKNKLYYPNMENVNWNDLYLKYHNKSLTTNWNYETITDAIIKMNQDEKIFNKSNIYHYLLLDEFEKEHDWANLLDYRAFSLQDKANLYEKEKGICYLCKKHYEFNEMQVDHITPYSLSGRTVLENAALICEQCNKIKSNAFLKSDGKYIQKYQK